MPLHKTPLIDSGPDRLRMMTSTWAQPTPAEAPDLAPLTDDRGVPRRSVRSQRMRTVINRRHPARTSAERHDEIQPVIDVPHHDEVSLAGGDKVDVPWSTTTTQPRSAECAASDKPWTGSQALVHTHFDPAMHPASQSAAQDALLLDDGHHRGPLRWNGDRGWAPRRRLRAAREHAGMTQYQLAVATNLTVTSIANLERGRVRHPRMVTMQRIAKALNVDMRWLCDE